MHDASYKLLFSHAQMVEDLLRGFVPQAWVQELDFSTLEKLNASYVADDLRDRHDDVVWRAAVELAQLIEPAPAELRAYQPQQRYLLLDEGAYSDQELAALHNLVAAVFRLENSSSLRDVLTVVNALVEWLKQPQQSQLRRAFTVWIRRVVLTDSTADTAAEPIIELDEVRTMLAQRVRQWEQDWRERSFA